MGSSFSMRGKPPPRKKKAAAVPAKGGAGGGEAVDQQETAGNASVREELAAKKAEEEKAKADAAKAEAAKAEAAKAESEKTGKKQPTDFKLPASVRAHVLSDTAISKMAAAVFAEAQNAKGGSEEIMALAVAVWNQSEALRLNPAEREAFGANNLDQLFENELMFENFGLDRHRMFHEAVAFGNGFQTQEQADTAVSVIDTVTQVVESGNPLPREYMVFSRRGLCPMPERVDQTSKIQFGALTFWAFDPAKGPEVVAKKEQQPTETKTLANALAPEPPPPA